MSRTGSLVTKKFARVLDVVRASRFRSTYGRLPRNNVPSLSADYWLNPGLRMFSINSNTNTDANR